MKLLVAGFGPFPGAPRNPSGELARALGRLRRPALVDVEIHAVVFPTVYQVMGTELSRLLKRLDPDAVLLFGLAGQSDHLRVETRAVNAASAIHPDAARALPPGRELVAKAPRERHVRLAVRRLIGAARDAGVPARLSRDAGRYVCNASLYFCLDPARRKRPRLVTFIHIPQPSEPRPRTRPGRKRLSARALVRAGEAILRALVAEARRP